MPLDADARAVVARAGYALRMLRRGAALPRCDWALDPGQGIDTSFPHAEAARVLSALACLRARMRFEEGENAEALDDIVAALTLARHVERDGTLDGLWAGYQAEQRLGEALALYLPRLDARTVKDLKIRLESLPPNGSAATATLRMEEAMLDWIAGEVREAKDGEGLLDFLSQLGTGPREPEKRRAEGRAFLADCGGTAAGVLRFAEELRRHAAPLAQKLDLPPDQVDRELRREEKKLAANPVFRVFAPVLHKVRVLQARADVRRALLAAALAVRLGGPAALKEHPDPVVGGPFERIALEGGFELRSRRSLDEEWHVPLEPPDDQPLTLRVGRHGG